MKRMKIYLTIILLLLLIFTTGTDTYAMNTGFILEELSEDNKNIFLSNVEISFSMSEPVKKSILCFDVNEEGMIALGQEDGQRKEICIYSLDGVFQYGYSFNSGQSFGVEWDGNNLNICFVRSDVIISVDRKGTIIEIKKVSDNAENNGYWNDLLYRTECEIDDTKYILRNDMGILNIFASSYNQLIEQKATGERILYDVNSFQYTKVIVIGFMSIILFGIIILMVSYSARKTK